MKARASGAMHIDQTGWVASVSARIKKRPSPNCDARPDGVVPSLIVIHNISLPPGEFEGDAVERLFTNTLDLDAHPYYAALRGLLVSAHFMIRRGGDLIQFVSCAARAWHAGISCFEGRPCCNDFSIGIELEGSDDHAFEAAQYRSLGALTDALAQRYRLEAVAGHADIAPGRKTDPGSCFDWDVYLAQVGAKLRRANAEGAS